MRVVALSQFGGPEVLQLVDHPKPAVAAGEVRIRVVAAAVNPTDTLLRSGALAAAIQGWRPPYIPGMDAAGIIDAVGSGVDLAPGTQVLAFVNPLRPEGGAQAEYVVVPRDQVAAVPASLSVEAAAGLPMNGLTADLALDLLGLRAGATIGVTGAAGALGGYSVQLAKQAGLRVIADASDRDRGLVRELGADVVVPRGPDVAGDLRRAVPEGVDGLIDAAIIGRPVLGAVKDGGTFVKCRPYELPAERGITVHQVMVFNHPAKRAALERLTSLAEKGKITLRTAAVLEAAQAAEAHRRLEAGGVRGRLLIRF